MALLGKSIDLYLMDGMQISRDIRFLLCMKKCFCLPQLSRKNSKELIIGRLDGNHGEGRGRIGAMRTGLPLACRSVTGQRQPVKAKPPRAAVGYLDEPKCFFGSGTNRLGAKSKESNVLLNSLSTASGKSCGHCKVRATCVRAMLAWEHHDPRC